MKSILFFKANQNQMSFFIADLPPCPYDEFDIRDLFSPQLLPGVTCKEIPRKPKLPPCVDIRDGNVGCQIAKGG